MVLVGAMLVFGERLNLYQWIGVMLAIISFFMLSRSGKKEGIDFKHNKWILFIILAAVAGAVSGLYDKYLMKQLPPMVVQSWYNVYQMFIMCPILALLWSEIHTHLPSEAALFQRMLPIFLRILCWDHFEQRPMF